MSSDPDSSHDKVELLLPAQNMKSIKAVKGIADAVYFGTDALNMRMNADNFPLKTLSESVEEIHSYGIKAFLTTNIILYENELEYLTQVLTAAKNAKIDAIIVHDMAAVMKAKEIGIPFHCSTQMSISNSAAAKFYEDLGAERIILAREISLAEIREITSKMKKAKIEAFIHGAQCTSVSGRCYFSAYVHDDPAFSANRGKCLQPCRNKWHLVHPNGTEMDYEDGFFFNSKDLNMIEHIPELIEAGIASFKIEGRMRDPHYVHTVGKMYRQAIDAYYAGNFTAKDSVQWKEELGKVYNRGFSTGFYFAKPSSEDISLDQSGNQGTLKKQQIGKITAYYRNAQAAKIELFHGPLKLGDEIIIEGAKMGTFLIQTIKSMQLKMKPITVTPNIHTKSSIIIGVGVDEPVKKGDWVYRYIQK